MDRSLPSSPTLDHMKWEARNLFEERVKSAFVPECDAKGAIEVLRSEPVSSSGAARIGTGRPASSGIVMLRSRIGANRVVDMLPGEQLLRIC